MPKKRSQPAQRKPRMDAQRNRERILEVAKDAFARSGAGTSLDDIAKQAGVGAGTLYRHFPTRDALLEAVYRTEVEKLAAAERKLAQDLSPIEALRAWMLLFIDHIATKQLIAPALNTLVQLGWSPQRPTGRAIERDEQAIAQWKRKRRPEIKKKPKNKGLSSSSSTKAG